jgi:hypothetical protein
MIESSKVWSMPSNSKPFNYGLNNHSTFQL